MWPQASLFNQDIFLVHVGQLATVGTSEYGESVLTSIATVACLVYTEDDKSSGSVPTITDGIQHFALIPSSITVAQDYHLQDVRDPAGNQVIADARVAAVRDFNSWRFGARIKQLYLEMTTNP